MRGHSSVALCIALAALSSGVVVQAAPAVAPAPAPSSVVPTTLYAHVTSPFQDFPLTTQAPDPKFRLEPGSSAASTLSCAPQTPVVNTQQDIYTLYGYSSPSAVDYNLTENGLPTVHPERGILGDVHLDQSTPMLFHWYWSGQVPAGGAVGAAAPTPNVVVHATLRAGDSISVDDTAYNAGPIVAEGESAPALLAGPASQGVDNDVVDGQTVYHFVVPMTIKAADLNRSTGFNLKVETFVKSDACPSGGHVMTSTIAIHSSPDHRPRLEFGSSDPITVGTVNPQWVTDQFVIGAPVRDAWGDYDIQNAALTLTGPGLDNATAKPVPQLQPRHEHNMRPMDLVYTWQVDPAPPAAGGDYHLHFAFTRVGGATSTSDVDVHLPPRGQEAPGPSAIGLLAALAGAVLLVRRRA